MAMQADILIVEDSRTQAELLRHVLEQQGYRVMHAPDGNAGLDQARRHIPALIISDIEMPGMGGYDMCRRLKYDARLRHVPVILLTSLSDPSDVVRGLESGADYYLTKPFDREFLLAQVESALATPLESNDEPSETTMEVVLQGQRRTVTTGPRQILNLLLSTYGNAVQRNRELVKAQSELTEQARQLRLRDAQLSEKNTQLERSLESERQALVALKKAETQMVEREKLASLGQMVAGIAHEINNPLAFVINNLAVLQRDFGAIGRLLELYKPVESALSDRPDILDPIRELSEQIDLAYMLSNLQELFARSRDGLSRIQQIVKDLRAFARLDESDLSEVDINAAIESTANIVRNKATEKQVEIAFEFGRLPPFTCYPAKINQVVMNLLTNAIDASNPNQTILVRTRGNDHSIAIEVSDTGCGVDPSIRDRIFDPFFTTKPPGQGTGLGLSISYSIVETHGGNIQVASTPGKGSTFTVNLPTRPQST